MLEYFTIVNSDKTSDPLVRFAEQTKRFHCKGLTVSVQRCEAISCGADKPGQITMFEKPVSKIRSCKYLGIHFENCLRFKKLFEYLEMSLDVLGFFCLIGHLL